MLNYGILFVALLSIFACKNKIKPSVNKIEKTSEKKRAKFEPEDGKVILFVGQENDAIGGLEEHNDGYLDHFRTPGGFTMYTKIRPGDESFGFKINGLCGVHTTDDWGDGKSNMSKQLADPDFKNMALAIGLEFFNHDEELATGRQDSLVVGLGDFMKSLHPRPVFLRIGYEFHGSWNGYNTEAYKTSFRRMKNMYDSMDIENVAYVWQSHGFDEPDSLLEAWCPGDEYVDWCGYSFFNRWEDSNMLNFARKKGKPVFIGEATPTVSKVKGGTDGWTSPMDLSNPEHAQLAREKWFKPFFKTIHDHPDLVKAISYINANWQSRPMWKDNLTFSDEDCRLQINENIADMWKSEIYRKRYLHASDTLFNYLWSK